MARSQASKDNNTKAASSNSDLEILVSFYENDLTELEQVLIDLVYSENAPARDYDKNKLFECLSAVENARDKEHVS